MSTYTEIQYAKAPEQIADECGETSALTLLTDSQALSECDDVDVARGNAEDDEPASWDGYRDDVRDVLWAAGFIFDDPNMPARSTKNLQLGGYPWATDALRDADPISAEQYRSLCARARAAYGAELARLWGEHADRLERAEEVA